MKENSDDSTNEINGKNEEEEQNNNEINNQSKQIGIIKHERISLEELFKKKMILSDELNKGRTGLVNIGNTCFMNSALQCLSNCYELTKYFLMDYYENDINMDNKLGSGGKISLVYTNLLEKLWKSDEKYLNPSSFKSIFAHFVKKFSGFAQQDSNEFLIYLLDKIHEDLNSVSKKPYIEIEEKGNDETDEDAAKRWWEKHLLRENSIIVDLFHGQFKSTITCSYCNRVAVNFDSYMSLSLPIPSGKFEIIIKYFGYEISNYHEFKIPITENTTVQNIIDIIKNELKKKNNNKIKMISNPPRKNKKKKKNQNKFQKEKNEEVSLRGDIVEMVLLTKNKNIYKVFINNDYIFSYLQEGYELVAYEKKINRENIYFYLTQYSHKYYILTFFYDPKTILFDYPFAIDIEPKQKIYNIYEKISDFLKIFDLNKNNKVETLKINFPFETINKEKEKEIGYLIYLNQYTNKKNNSICESIFSSKYINYLLLEKHSSSQSINNLKKELNLRDNDRLTLDINISFNLDQSKLPKYSINSEKRTYYSGNDINLYDCLNLFNSEEILEGDNEWYCNICKTHRDVNKKMDIFKAPYYLIIQLKRFKQDHEMGQSFIFNLFSSNKNTSLVSFPINDLDLSKYILSNDNSGKKYKLIGVINHYGGSSFGHYTAYCLNDNQWFEYNDESVSPIDENNLISSAAYVLFYKRINN